MEIRTLITFSKIAELNSFSKAADQLGYAQSTVTMQIKQLENELEVPLFDRMGKSIYLTEDGKQFLIYANQLIYLAEKAREDVAKKIPKGSLRLGVLGSICSSILPPILEEYHSLCPQVEMVVKIATTLDLVEMLNTNAVDIMLTLDDEFNHADWIKVAQRKEKIVFICSTTHPFAHQKEVDIQAVMKEKFILTEKNCNYRHKFEEYLLKKNLQIRPYLEIGNMPIIQEFVGNHAALSLLPEITVEKKLREKSLATFEIMDYSMEMWTQLFYNKKKWQTPAMRSFIALLKEKLFCS